MCVLEHRAGLELPASRRPTEDAMTSTDSFAALLERFHTDEDAAARAVLRRYSHQLLALTRRQFVPRLARRIDPEDVVQSAFKSFFVRHRDGKLRVENWDALWGLLALITRRKCADRAEYLRAGRRDVGREVSAPEGGDQPWPSAPDREPSPPDAAILAETLDHLFRAVEGDERQVLELSLQGHTAAEIALRLGKALRSVHRLRERLQKRLLRLQGVD
jgi:RNA polymerase sigma-70 factor (ECF subfamily)